MMRELLSAGRSAHRHSDISFPIASRLFLLVRCVVGGLLLATAGLKLHGQAASPVPNVGWYSAPAVQSALVIWETFLGVWLLSGWFAAASWVAAVGTFGVFAAVSGFLGWQGIVRCGCFGPLPASPWYAFGVDLAVLAALAVARPPARQLTRASVRDAVLGLGRPALAVALILGLLAASAHLAFGSIGSALATLRGQSVVVSNDYVDFGPGRPGEVLRAGIRVFNYTKSSVTVLGGTSDCTCDTTGDLPVKIAPGGSADLTIQLIIPPTSPGVITRNAALWTDCETRRQVRLHLGGRIE